MPRTHHATRTWRLSCGCLRDYPGMLTGKIHQVLCVACLAPATTLYAYPERRCGVTAAVTRDGRRVIASCTEAPGNKDCEAGVHHDKYLIAGFGAPMALRAGRQGQTGRA